MYFTFSISWLNDAIVFHRTLSKTKIYLRLQN